MYIYICMFVPTQVHSAHKHICAYTQQEKIFNASVEWWKLPPFPKTTPTSESANSTVTQRVQECGKSANTALTLQRRRRRRRSDLITSVLATQPVSPEILFLSPSRAHKAASPPLHIQGTFTHTVPVWLCWHSHISPDTTTLSRLWSAHCHIEKLQPLLTIVPQGEYTPGSATRSYLVSRAHSTLKFT